MSAPVVIEKLCRRYEVAERRGLFRSVRREIDALVDVSLELRPGEIFGLLGPNGAGKTTLIKVLTTLLLPTSGRAWINGYRLGEQDRQIRASIGCMLMGERGLYWKLTGRENLHFFGALYRLPPAARRARADALIARLELAPFVDRAVESYSSGQKMKLALAKALLNDAPLVILDEPTNTLDFPTARALLALVRELRDEGRTIIYTTHIMAEADNLCDRVAIIDRGRILALDSPTALKRAHHGSEVLTIEGEITDRTVGVLRAVPDVTMAEVRRNGSTHLTLASADAGALLPGLLRTLVDHQSVIHHIQRREPSLEDVFIAHTGRSLAEDTREET